MKLLSIFLITFFLISLLIPVPKKTKKKSYNKPLTKKQKYNLIKAELELKRKTDKIPENDILWGVYQLNLAEALAKEHWIDYEITLNDMGTLLYKEKRYKGAIEYYLKAMFIECCIPHYDGTGKYTIQVFSEKKAILKYKLCCFYQYCLNSIKELKLSDNELKDIYMNIFMGEIKAPITQKEGWKIIYEKYKKTKT